MQNLEFLEFQLKMPLMDLPVRTTVVNLKQGKVMIAPGTKIKVERLKELTGITDLVATNFFHCSGMRKSYSVFNRATCWGPVGVAKLRQDTHWDKELNEGIWPYQDELVLIPIEGMPKVCECVFFHKESKSLIVTDLCFNLQDAKGIGARIMLGLFGSYRKFAISRFFVSLIKDKNKFKESMQKILAYDFDNIVLSHGHNIKGNAKEMFVEALKVRKLL